MGVKCKELGREYIIFFKSLAHASLNYVFKTCHYTNGNYIMGLQLLILIAILFIFPVVHVIYRLWRLCADHVMFMWLLVTPSSAFVLLVSKLWISRSVESG